MQTNNLIEKYINDNNTYGWKYRVTHPKLFEDDICKFYNFRTFKCLLGCSGALGIVPPSKNINVKKWDICPFYEDEDFYKCLCFDN